MKIYKIITGKFYEILILSCFFLASVATANEAIDNLKRYRTWLQENFAGMVEEVYRTSVRDVFDIHFQNFMEVEERVQEKALAATEMLAAAQQALENFQGVQRIDYTKSDYWDLTLVQQNAKFAAEELKEVAEIFDQLAAEEENACTAQVNSSLALSYGLWFNLDIPQFKFDPNSDWGNPSLPSYADGLTAKIEEQGADQGIDDADQYRKYYRMAFSYLTSSYGIFGSVPVIGVAASAFTIFYSYHKFKKSIKRYNRNIREAQGLYQEFDQIAAQKMQEVQDRLPAIIAEECKTAQQKYGQAMMERYAPDYSPAQLAQYLHLHQAKAQQVGQELTGRLEMHKAWLAQRYADLPQRSATQRAAWVAQVPQALNYTFTTAVTRGQQWGAYLRKTIVPELNNLAAAQQKQAIEDLICIRQRLLRQVATAYQTYGPTRGKELQEKVFPVLAQSLGPTTREI